MDEKIEDWIHSRVELETNDGGDIIITPKPVEGEPPPTGSILIDPRGKVLMNHGDIPGPNQLAMDLGVRRFLKTAAYIGGSTLVGAVGSIAQGTPWPAALLTAAASTIGGALTAGIHKTNKEINKLPGAEEVSNWVIFGRIILEVLKLIRELINRVNKRASQNGKSSAGSLSK